MRNYVDRQLSQLNKDLTEMGELCEDAISYAVNALLENNMELADEAKSIEKEIDKKERDIESLCLKLLLQQQPVARDLRQISSALKMITDMERIGDQAADIAEILHFTDLSSCSGAVHIAEMARATAKMVTESVEAYVRRDIATVQKVIAHDDVVDDLFSKVKSGVIDMLADKSLDGEQALDLLMIAKYLERIGDHAVNIAEWVMFSITGGHVN